MWMSTELNTLLFLLSSSAFVVGTLGEVCLRSNEVSVSTNTKECSWTSSFRHRESCGWWRKCYYYTQRINTYRVCNDEYTGKSCDQPICAGKSGAAACQPEGYCKAPDQCAECEKHYYPDGPKCTHCNPIANCVEEICSTSTNQECVRCEHTYPYGTAYKNSITRCEAKCSWLDKRRCYPGECGADGLLIHCTCFDGFTGTNDDCRHISVDPEIVYGEFILAITDGEKDAGSPDSVRLVSAANSVLQWTNNEKLNVLVVHAIIRFQCNDSARHSYINDTACGLTFAGVKYEHVRGGYTIKSAIASLATGQVSNDSPYVGELDYSKKFKSLLATQSSEFSHGDRLKFTITAKNGGHIKYKVVHLVNVIGRYDLVGRTLSQYAELGFDFVGPTHICIGSSTCTKPPLSVNDLTTTLSNNGYLEGWFDALSGIDRWEIEVFEMSLLSGYWSPTKLVFADRKNRSTTESETNQRWFSFRLERVGLHSVTVIAYDIAGNHLAARRLILYDDNSTVSLNPNASTIRVTVASAETGYTWITNPTSEIHFQWPQRFINEMHSPRSGSWLGRVRKIDVQLNELMDDHNGAITVAGTVHKLGIVRMEMSYQTTYQKVQVDHPFSVIPGIGEETTVHEPYADGKKLLLRVRGYDVFNAYAEETFIVKEDSSPPIIKNIWLTKGDRLNVSVHSLAQLNDMTIEWETYDGHSGLHEVTWALFNNYTADTEPIIHGHSYMPPQGEAETESECLLKYSTYPRGSNCYCSPFEGCYHQHFQVKPEITNDSTGGINLDKHVGIHDAEYYIRVTVTNKAMLSTVLDKKISIDTTAPHEGVVHDGLLDSLEVDFQQSRVLEAHWDGFFDRESGVLFYQYGFGKSCLPAEMFDSNNPHMGVVETYSTHGTFVAPEEGKYYATVVAFNRALDPSTPVCSDGATVDTSEPDIEEIMVENIHVRGGLVVDNEGKVWYLNDSRMLLEVVNTTAECSRRATLINEEDLSLIPRVRNVQGKLISIGNSVCGESEGYKNQKFYLRSKYELKLSWVNSRNTSSIYEYEVGISSTMSTVPDREQYISTKKHRHFHLFHPNLEEGELFYILIRITSKAEVQKIKQIGPFLVDTTKPVFSGEISLRYFGGYFVTTWQENAFTDGDDSFELKYMYSVGSTSYSEDLLPFRPLDIGTGCEIISKPPNCTSVDVEDLHWGLHGNYTYYVTVKVENTAGFSTSASSNPYVHQIQLPSVGVLMEVDPTVDRKFLDIEDIDFSTTTDSVTGSWHGFIHPHTTVNYVLCVGTSPENEDFISCVDVGEQELFTITGLHLDYFKTYYLTLTAHSEVGNVTVSSDGITVVKKGADLMGIQVYDGSKCVTSENETNSDGLNHHEQDPRVQCTEDIDYQSSINSLHAYWTVPADMKHFTPNVYWAVEQRHPVAAIWQPFLEFEHIHTSSEAAAADIILQSGHTYRTIIKFCAADICFNSLNTDGVTVIANPPITGDFIVSYEEENNASRIDVSMRKFRDPDIRDEDDRLRIIHHYEWAFIDDSVHSKTVTKWKRVLSSMEINDTHISFSTNLDKPVAFTKCWRLAVKGYSFAGLSSTVSADIRDCADLSQVQPRSVIDAVGDHVEESDDAVASLRGQSIFLELNALWTQPDQDYTPYSNVLSAVWPSLRYKTYTWAVLEQISENPTVFYESEDEVTFTDLCSEPDALKCGQTEDEYVNVRFETGEINHGKRYLICIHGAPTTVEHEEWVEELPELSACSDGVTVDLTPPTQGTVWIGPTLETKYQTSTQDVSIHWKSFLDLEETGKHVHSSGIAGYEIALGTAPFSTDTVPYRDVGVTNHATFHDLSLQNGYSYYATVKAKDYVNRTTVSASNPIKIDTTPPGKSDKSITYDGRHFSDPNRVKACWRGVFSDLESGIEKFEWSIGSAPSYDDVMNFTAVVEECGESKESQPLTLHEGHAYFVSVKAFNGIGLYTIATSWAFSVDYTPPIAGHVYDGSVRSSYRIDKDYVHDSTKLSVHWEGFYDPHSAIQEYIISIGTQHIFTDVLAYQPLGITNEFSISGLVLRQGVKYFTTVTACNTADLCTSVISDGIMIDTSPPVAGQVWDGTEHADIHYQAPRSFIGAKWFGFTDPQSDISHYVWRAGTAKGSDNIVQSTNIHLSHVAFVPNLMSVHGLELPVNQKIYITLRCYNKAGLYTEVSSNGFIVDISPPVFTKALTLSEIGTIVPSTHVYRSTLKVQWAVEDAESYVQHQYLSISSNIGGDFNLSSTKVNGVARDFIFTDLNLHDGSVYDVTVTSCNGAYLCTDSVLNDIFVDTTPPTPGMFAINTDHAAGLDRQPEGYMTWSFFHLNLAWLGFADLHSGVDHYMVTIGSSYMASDLNDGAPEPTKVYPVSGEIVDEGNIQVHQIRTKFLGPYEVIFIAVWAVNRVGLSSPMIHSQFHLINNVMTMELVRMCSSHTCQGHCVCAPQNQRCLDQSETDCITDTSNQLISVRDIVNLQSQNIIDGVGYTPTDNILAATWTVIKGDGLSPLWYEWSVGYSMFDEPAGIFNTTSERVWHDAGQQTTIIFSLPQGRKLTEESQYSFFVRAWYNESVYLDFKSSGVIVNKDPPRISQRFGRTVKELISVDDKEVDYIRPNQSLLVDWTSKFLNASVNVKYFQLYVSTSPGGHDVLEIGGLPPEQTIYNLSYVELVSYVRYYTNIVAFNHAGLSTTVTSDSVMVDPDTPSLGIVMDSDNRQYQNRSDVAYASWHGFSDIGSGMKDYYWCATKHDKLDSCFFHTWMNVKLHTRVAISLDVEAVGGDKIHSKVYAIDFAGHASEEGISDGVVVDKTPPVRENRIEHGENLVVNPSFEDDSTSVLLENIDDGVDCNTYLSGWGIIGGGCSLIVSTDESVSGQNFVMIKASIRQTITNIEVGGKYKVTFYTSHLPFASSVSSNREGFLQLNNDTHIFLLHTKPARSDGQALALSWILHTFYFTAVVDSVDLTIGGHDLGTGIAVDEVHVQQMLLHDNPVAEMHGHVQSHTVYLDNWSSVHAAWHFEDPESPIIDYTWAIGYTKGGTQLQDFRSVGIRSFASNSSVTLVHNSVIHITVVATNAAELRTVSYSNPMAIDLTPPHISYINDGTGEDLQFQDINIISANWEIFEPESGIELCIYAIGFDTSGTDLQNFTTLDEAQVSISVELNASLIADRQVHVTLRCTNKAGLSSTRSTDGVKVLFSSPRAEYAVVEVLGSSFSQFPARDSFHGDNSSLRIRWSGFEDDVGIDSFIVQIEGLGTQIYEQVYGQVRDYTFLRFQGLNLTDGTYSISVIGINIFKMQSEKVETSLNLITKSPNVNDGRSIQFVWKSNILELTAHWQDVFSSNAPLFYEVCFGTVAGSGNLLQWQETTNTRLSVKFKDGDIGAAGLDVFVDVKAVAPSGQFKSVHGQFLVSKT